MVVVTGESAMRLMSDRKTFDSLEPAPQSVLGSWSQARIGDIDELGGYGIFATKENPLHVLVGDKGGRIQSERVVSHIWSSRLPGGSLCHLAPGVAVTSPEFCYLLAGRRGTAPAAAVGMEACGAYGKDGSSRGFADRKAISSLASLKSYLDGARGCRGVKAARAALDLVIEGSRSPLETKTAILLTAPTSCGGYGIPSPKSNWPVWPAASELSLFYDSYYLIDLCWPDKKVSLECDSYAYHSSKDERDDDARKRNALTSIGWTCLTTTAGQLSGAALDTLAQQVCRALGIAFQQPPASLRDSLIESVK